MLGDARRVRREHCKSLKRILQETRIFAQNNCVSFQLATSGVNVFNTFHICNGIASDKFSYT